MQKHIATAIRWLTRKASDMTDGVKYDNKFQLKRFVNKKTVVVLSIVALAVAYPVYQSLVKDTEAAVDLPTITSVLPGTGLTTGGGELTISGSDFMTDAGFKQAYAGNMFTLALDELGNVYTWGSNNMGQLGDGSTIDKHVPQNIMNYGAFANLGDSKIVQIATGNTNVAIALDDQGRVYTWGNNYNGLIGNGKSGTANSQYTPLNIMNQGAFATLGDAKIIRVAMGNAVAAALDDQGRVYTWGANSSGNLGNNTTTNQYRPIRISAYGDLSGKYIVDISAGYNVIAIDSDGELYTWGPNGDGQVGNDSAGTNQLTPLNIMGYGDFANIGTAKIVQAVSGYWSSVALDSDGNVYTWGNNIWGQIGNGVTTRQTTPLKISSFGDFDGKTIKKLANNGGNHHMALDDQNNVYAWGHNSDGQIGNGLSGSGNNQLTPLNIMGYGAFASLDDSRIVQLSSTGISMSLAIDSNGKLYAWGDNTYGQVGNGTTVQQLVPLNVSELSTTVMAQKSAIKSIYVGGEEVTDFTVNSDSSITLTTPPHSSGTVDITLVTIDGQIMTYEDGFTYNLPETTVTGITPSKGPVVGGQAVTVSGTNLKNKDFIQVSSGQNHTIALDAVGDVWAWGYNNNGQIGNGGTTTQSTPIRLNDSASGSGLDSTVKFTKVAAGYLHTMAIDTEGNLWAWGDNAYRQAGGSSSSDFLTPQKIDTATITGWKEGDKFVDIAGGYYYSMAVTSSGDLYSWGRNSYYELGNRPTNNGSFNVPTIVNGVSDGTYVSEITADTKIITIAAGGYHSLAIDSTGNMYAWGYNSAYQIGDGNTTTQRVPLRINGHANSGIDFETKFRSVGAGSTNSLAVDVDGNLYAWGSNTYGQIGNGTLVNQQALLLLNDSESGSGLDDTIRFKEVASGQYHSMALTADGDLYTWGYNQYATIGNGTTTTPQTTPYNVSSATSVKYRKLGGGGNTHSSAISSTNGLYGWGRNNYYQATAAGSTTTVSRPVAILNAQGDRIFSVKFDGIDSLGFTVDSDTSLTVHAPAHSVGLVDVLFTTNGGAITKTDSYTYSNPPIITGVSPDSGSMAGGTTMTIVGTNLDNVIKVSAGGYDCSNVAIVSSTEITCQTTAAKTYGTVDVSVADADRQTSTLVGGFTYQIPTPSITSLSPSIGSTEGGQTVTLTGNNFMYNEGVDIIQIASGDNNSFALDSNGNVYSWGWGEYSQTGNGSTANLRVPTNIMGYGDFANMPDGAKIVQIAAGTHHTIALDSEGNVYTWGGGRDGWNYGVIGNGAEVVQSTPLNVMSFGDFANMPDGAKIIQVAAGDYHSLALDSKGNIYAWGQNNYGQIGNGTSGTNQLTPLNVSNYGDLAVLPVGVSIDKIITGSYNASMVIDTNGELYVWGYNSRGQIGNNSTNNQLTPLNIMGYGDFANMPDGAKIVEASSSNNVTVALDSDGNVYTWGGVDSGNNHGQLGNGEVGVDSSVLTPTSIMGYGDFALLASDAKITDVSSYGFHSIAADNKGNVYTWGWNLYGEIGNGLIGSTRYVAVPLKISSFGAFANWTAGRQITQVAAGYSHNITLDNTGNVYAWGYGLFGQLGNNSTSNKTTPLKISGYGGLATKSSKQAVASIAVGGINVEDFTVSSNGSITLTTPPHVYGTFDVVLTTIDGQKVTYENAYTYQLPTPTITGISPDKGLAAGGDSVTVTGSGFATKFVQVSAGSSHSLALDSAGEVYSWGVNTNGRLGNGTTTTSLVPINISRGVNGSAIIGKKIVQVVAGNSHSLALDVDGNVYAWGLNNSGQLGSGGTSASTKPIQVPLGVKIIKIASSHTSHSSFALDADGNVYAWGYNNHGQLGNGTNSNVLSPINISSGVSDSAIVGKTIVKIAPGSGFCLAADSAGEVYSWGVNTNGRLGNGTTTTSLVPINISNGVDGSAITNKRIVSVDAGAIFSVAVDSDGEIYSWGGNTSGQIGDGTTTATATLVPKNISRGVSDSAITGKRIINISSGHSFMLALDEDGKVYAWGSTGSGNLGDGTTNDSSVPKGISEGISGSAITNKVIVALSAGNNFSTAIDSSGNLYTWGYNGASGKLGNNSTAHKTVPINISQLSTTKMALTIPGSISLGSATCSNLTVTSVTKADCTTSAHVAGNVDVVLTALDNQTVTLANGYTYYETTNPPVLNTLTPADNSVVLNWSAPTYNGYSAVSGYKIEVSTDYDPDANVGLGNAATATWSVITSDTANTDTSFIYDGSNTSEGNGTGNGTLDPSTTYSFRVSAINEAGASNPSNILTTRPSFIDLTIDNTELNIDIMPDLSNANGVLSSVKHTASFTTNTANGIKLVITTNTDHNNLVNASDSTKTIPSIGNGISTGVLTNPLALTANTWGFAMPKTGSNATNQTNSFNDTYTVETNSATSSSLWAQVPNKNQTPLVIKSTSAANASSADNTDIFYGVRSGDITKEAGYYRTTIVYTSVVNL